MERTSKERVGSGGVVLAVAGVLLLLLPVFYILSIGPLVWLHDRGMMSDSIENVVERVYWPLECATAVPMVERSLMWYVSLWERAPLPAPPPAMAAPRTLPAPTAATRYQNGAYAPPIASPGTLPAPASAIPVDARPTY